MTFVSIIAAYSPLVHPTTPRVMIEVEAGGNPSTNHPQALRDRGGDALAFVHPQSGPEVDLTQHLFAQGARASVALAQINPEQVAKEHLILQDLCEPCVNLAAPESLLLECEANQARHVGPDECLRVRRMLTCYIGEYKASARSHDVSDVGGAALRGVYRRFLSVRSEA